MQGIGGIHVRIAVVRTETLNQVLKHIALGRMQSCVHVTHAHAQSVCARSRVSCVGLGQIA